MTQARTNGAKRLPAGHADQPPRLRVWSSALELARDLFPLAKRASDPLAESLIRPLMDAALRLCIIAARSRGDEPAGVLSQGGATGDLAEIETRLHLCAELGLVTGNEHSRLVRRVVDIRCAGRMRGSALVIVVLLCSVLAALGLLLLQMADTESSLVRRTREREQIVQAAETGARMVKAWFDAPITGERGSPRRTFLGRFDLRDAARFDRSARLIDADGNPATAAVHADGSAGREPWREGRALWSDGALLDFFHKPWRGGIPETLLGTAAGPDLLLLDREGTDLLDEINHALFGNQQDGIRIERIAIYAPRRNAAFERLGMATIEVTAVLHRRLDRTGSVPLVPAGARSAGRLSVRMGLAEIPTDLPRGPLQACGDITVGGQLRAAWGRVTAAGDIHLATSDPDHDIASTWPYRGDGSHIAGILPGEPLERWLSHAPAVIEDPWLQVLAGGSLFGMEGMAQPFPHDPDAAIDGDHSNLFQGSAGIGCPALDHALWKRLVMQTPPGDPADAHTWYLVPEPGTGLYRRFGRGPARSVRDWTHGQEGIFFFDTMDGAPPRAGNLAPPVTITGGDWHVAGIMIMNVQSFEASAVRGRLRAVLPPGEPYGDADGSGSWSAGETFVNLRYPDVVDAAGSPGDFVMDPLAAGNASIVTPEGDEHTVTTTLSRDPRGFALLAEVNLFGVLYNAGDIVADGEATHFGSLLAGGNIIARTSGSPSARVLYDERLGLGQWPPPEIAMPRTWVTFWEVEGL